MNIGIYKAICIQLSHGVVQTIIVTFSCFTTGIVVAFLVVLLRTCQFVYLNYLLDGMVFIFRGIPILVLVFLIYFGLPGFGFTMPPLLAMNLSLGMMTGFYLSEVFRGSLLSIDTSELLAARAMGFSRLQQLMLIEIPQMLRLSVPGMVNEFTTTLKNSPYAYAIGIPEMMRQATSLIVTSSLDLQIYLCIGIIYFLIYRISLALTMLWGKNIISRMNICQ